MNVITGNESAHPEVATHGQKIEGGLYGRTYSVGGMTIRQQFAAMASDDFSMLPVSLQQEIVGYDQPSYEYDPGFNEMKEIKPIYNFQYALWLAKGRANWKVIQADALIAALNAKL